jgi:hypothetical protein
MCLLRNCLICVCLSCFTRVPILVCLSIGVVCSSKPISYLVFVSLVLHSFGGFVNRCWFLHAVPHGHRSTDLFSIDSLSLPSPHPHLLLMHSSYVPPHPTRLVLCNIFPGSVCSTALAISCLSPGHVCLNQPN